MIDSTGASFVFDFVSACGLGSRTPGGVELVLRDTGAVVLIPYVSMLPYKVCLLLNTGFETESIIKEFELSSPPNPLSCICSSWLHSSVVVHIANQ